MGDNDIEPVSPEFPPARPPPAGYVHRPVIEFFTGLSCPACMGGPHQDMDKLWQEDGGGDNVPFTFIAFHELNGGGVDDLATDESRERMRHYQPGVSGTPDAEFDGGYIELGGLTGTTSISYQTATEALADSTTRYERQFDPWNPRQTLRNEFKFVDLVVKQVFTGSGYAVIVEATYLGMDTLISQNLQGSLYVFMIEDNVTAYSTVMDENITNHNVFRGYAIKDDQFTLSEGDTYQTAGEWEIPTDATVPVKPGDLTAVAVVYDIDDTDSENENQGNHADVPRAIQSATPQSSAFDLEQDLPVLDEITITYDGQARMSARADDDNGISMAFVLYNTEAANATQWESVEMTVTGEELCDESGACYAYTNSECTADIPIGSGETVYYMLLIYDGDANEGKTPIMTYTAEGSMESAGGGGISLAMAAMILGVLLLLYGFYSFMTQKRRRETVDVEPMTAEGIPSQPVASAASKGTSKTVMMGAIILGMILISAGAVASVMPSGDEKIPDFAMVDVDGNEFRLSDFRGEVVMLEFMATWCSDCKKMTKEMKDTYAHYDGDIIMISLDIDRKESPEQLKSYADENGAKWIFAFPADFSMVMSTFDIYEIPKTLIIDRDGFITFEEILSIPSDDQIAAIDAARSGAAPAIALSSMPLAILAFAAGIASFFSPCSFPMLPGYVGYYFGKDSETERKKSQGVVRRALPVGLAAALGILLVYLLIGTLIMIIGSPILPYIPLLAPFVAVMIIVFGLLLLTNFQYYSVTDGVKNIVDVFTSKIRFGNRSLKERIDDEGAGGIFVYGMGYGMAAAGCTLPVFLFIIVGALSSGGIISGLGIFFVYGLGAAIFMVAVTLLVAASKDTVIDKLRMSTEKIKIASAVFLIIAGLVLMAMYVVTFVA